MIMKNTKLCFLKYILLIIYSLPSVAFGQKILQLSGTISAANDQYSDVRVFVLKDTSIVDTRKVLQGGIFFAEIKVDSSNMIKVSKKNHIPQIFKIINDERADLKLDTQYILKDVRIKLFEYYDSIPVPEFDQPVGSIKFLPDSNKYTLSLDPIVEATYKKLKAKKDADELYYKTYKPIFDEKIGQSTKEALLGNMEAAMNLLHEAKLLFPKNPLTTAKAKEYERMKRAVLEKNRLEKTNMYRTIINKADAEFNVQNYDQARNLYVQAQSIKPEEQYPSYMMKRIEEFIGIKETKQMDVLKIAEYYERTTHQADSLLKLKQYAQAKLLYQKAIRLNRTETYAKSKLATIASIIGEENKQVSDSLSNEKKYASTIALADNALKAKNYTDAIGLYRNSLSFKPKESYPADQIRKIQEIQIKNNEQTQTQKEIDQKYQQLIKDAEFYLGYQKLSEAENLFNEALKVKPTDPFIKSKIQEIKNLKQLQLDKEHITNRKEEEYTDFIKTADSYAKFENYKEAIRYYNSAVQLKPIEPYPKSQLIKINEIIKEQERKLKLENSYKNSILLADKAFEKKEYYDAKNLYIDALFQKHEDQYAKEKISKLNSLIQELEKTTRESNEKQIAYSNAISKGELNIRNNNLTEAKLAFQQAKDLGINTKYANDRINDIEKQIKDESNLKEEQKKREEKYKLTLLGGDESFKAQNYAKAKECYSRAMEMQFNDSYPRDRINEIENIMNLKLQSDLDQKSKETAFQSAVSSGDSSFANKRYFEASLFYKRANSLKKTDESVASKLQKAETLVEEEKKKEFERKKKEKDFSNLIFQAENLILIQNFEEAIRVFEEAQKMNPSSPTPKERIAEARSLIEKKQKQKEDELKDNQIMAEKALSENDFRVARFYFEKIIQLNKDNQEAIKKLKEFDKLEEIKKKETKVKAYAEAIEEGKKAYQIKELNVAEYYYSKAMEINPDDQSPTEMIEKIKSDKAALRQKTIDDTYTDYTSSGNKAIETKDYGAAISYFSKAKALKPLEPYPDQKIIEIKQMIAK